MFASNTSITSIGWRFGIFAGLVFAIFALFPQFKLWYATGTNWNGHYAYNDIDEVAYAGYLKAVIDGRPRKNDPYTGDDQSVENPQPESLFSIQFATPYLLGLPARLLGVSAPWAMIIAGALAGFLSALVLYLLMLAVKGDKLFAMAGSIAVLAGGALAAGEGAINSIAGNGIGYPYFPFLRRYIPAVPFPVFLFFMFAVFVLINTKRRRASIIFAGGAFLAFSFLVFSYFYLWTSAAAFLACTFLGVLIFRGEAWKEKILRLSILGATLLLPLSVYAILLADRGDSMDNVQLLVLTHSPDLFRFPEFISYLALLILFASVYFAKRKVDSAFIFSFAVSITPIILFNQQVLSGRSLQPIHYQVFVGNYVAAFGLMLAIGTLVLNGRNKRGQKIAWTSLALLAIGWGFLECFYTVQVLDDANILRDQTMKVGEFLTAEGKKSRDAYRDTIFSASGLHSDDSPTTAPQAVLWARHQHVFAGLSWEESKERYYKFLYFYGLDGTWLRNSLRQRDISASIALFGWGRNTNRLASNAKPVTATEIDQEAEKFQSYVDNFGKTQAYSPLLTHLVVQTSSEPSLENIDLWYKRDEGTEIGEWKVYRLVPLQP